MLKFIWVNYGRFMFVIVFGIYAFYFYVGAVFTGYVLLSLVRLVVSLVTSIPSILVAALHLPGKLAHAVIENPVDSLFVVLGSIVLLAIVLGYRGYFDESEQVIRRGSRLQSPSNVRRRLSGQGRERSNDGVAALPRVQHRRGSRLLPAQNRSIRQPWSEKLWSLFESIPSSFGTRRTKVKTQIPRRGSPTSSQPARRRRMG